MILEKQRCLKVKEFAKFLVLSEGKLPLHLESVEDSGTSVSIYASRKAILPSQNYVVNFTFISWHFHRYKVSFFLEP